MRFGKSTKHGIDARLVALAALLEEVEHFLVETQRDQCLVLDTCRPMPIPEAWRDLRNVAVVDRRRIQCCRFLGRQLREAVGVKSECGARSPLLRWHLPFSLRSDE